MMEGLSEWIRGVVITSLLVSLLVALVPDQSFRRIARLTGGLIFLLAALQGVNEVDFSRFSADFETYREEIEAREKEFEKENETLMLQSIAQGAETYILDKAKTLGLNVTVSVQAKADENGSYYLEGAHLTGDYSRELSLWISETLGLGEEKQEWSSG